MIGGDVCEEDEDDVGVNLFVIAFAQQEVSLSPPGRYDLHHVHT